MRFKKLVWNQYWASGGEEVIHLRHFSSFGSIDACRVSCSRIRHHCQSCCDADESTDKVGDDYRSSITNA